jgi:glutathione synthase
VPEIENGEIRTLVAAGEIIGSYRRLPINSIHANLSAGSQALPVATKDINMRLINDIVADLKRRRIGYAAIDTVGDYLMEVNLANPGGLGTLATVYGRDFGADVVSAVTARYVT